MEEKEKQLKKLKRVNIILLIVCIVLLVVSVGFIIRTYDYSTSSGSCYDVQREEKKQARAMFNESFIPCLGENISGNQTKNLIANVMSSNSRNKDHQVELDDTGITKLSDVSNKKEYKAKEFYDDDGYINKIIITDITNSGKGD